MKTYKTLLAEAQPWAKEVFEKIDKKLSQMTLRSYDKLPDGTTPDGFHKEKSICWWTNGFWGGTNHLMYMQTGNEDYLKTARRSEEKMDEALFHQFDGLHHDVGFMWHLLSGINARLYKDPQSRNRNLLAAATLSSRFVLGGNFIRAWNGTWCDNYNWTIVDCMMNIPLLYWASEEVKDDRFKNPSQVYDEARELQRKLDASRREAMKEQGSDDVASAGKEEKKSKSETYKGPSVLSYSLDGRKGMSLHVPVYKCYGGGDVYVQITVNRKGYVVAASIIEG
jgi:hypothetical protein